MRRVSANKAPSRKAFDKWCDLTGLAGTGTVTNGFGFPQFVSVRDRVASKSAQPDDWNWGTHGSDGHDGIRLELWKDGTSRTFTARNWYEAADIVENFFRPAETEEEAIRRYHARQRGARLGPADIKFLESPDAQECDRRFIKGVREKHHAAR